ncbi:FxsC protein, partial [Actinoplanes nipponensis]
LGTSGSGLIPLRWLPPRTMPTAAQVVQYVPEPPHEAGSERGIRQLLRIQRNRDDYLEFVTTVAELVMDAATNDPLPAAADRVRLELVPSAFHDPAPPHRGGLSPIETQGLLAPSDEVYFVVAAPTAQEAAEESMGRGDRQFYGDSARAWSPFRPVTTAPLLDEAIRIAADRSLIAHGATLDELDECLRRARRDNQIVVLLVDPWSTRMADHHDVLHRYDRREDHPAAVMILWSRDDEETQANARELTSALGRTFPRNLLRPHTITFRQAVLTPETFRADLQIILEELRNRAIAHGLRRPRPGPAGSRAILEGP